MQNQPFSMEAFFRKIKLIQDFHITLPIAEEDFVDQFHDQVQESSLGMLSDPFEQYSTKGPDYKGWIRQGEFEMKLRRKMFSFTLGLSRARGKYYEEGRELSVQGEVNGFSNWLIPIFAGAIGIYIIATLLVLSSGESVNDAAWLFPLLLLHAAFMMGVPYFLIRREVGRIKRDLEGEFLR